MVTDVALTPRSLAALIALACLACPGADASETASETASDTEDGDGDPGDGDPGDGEPGDGEPGDGDGDPGDGDGDEPSSPALYVSLDGDDQNPGTYEAPLRTFDAALAAWTPGWEILVFGGQWSERLDVPGAGTPADPIIIAPVPGERPVLDATSLVGGQPLRIDGRYVRVEGFEVTGSDNQCVSVDGQDVTIADLDVHGCVSHGVQIRGQRVIARGLTIHETVLENEGEQGSWGSGLKVAVGGENVLLERNHVFHNWGEGIAVTRGVGVEVRDNWSHDNYSVNIYIDNSHHVLVEANLASSEGLAYLKNGERPIGIMLGEEFYEGWGPQLSDVRIQNNLIYACGTGIGWWGAEIDGGGLQRVTIVHNTIWGGNETAISIAYDPEKTEDSIIANNLVQQPDDAVAWIEDRTGLDMHHNFWVGPAPDPWRQCDGTGDVSGDPGLLAAPGITAASFRLGEASAARDAGAVLDEVPLDFEGRARVSGASPGVDIGAMEYGDPGEPAAFDEWFD